MGSDAPWPRGSWVAQGLLAVLVPSIPWRLWGFMPELGAQTSLPTLQDYLASLKMHRLAFAIGVRFNGRGTK